MHDPALTNDECSRLAFPAFSPDCCKTHQAGAEKQHCGRFRGRSYIHMTEAIIVSMGVFQIDGRMETGVCCYRACAVVVEIRTGSAFDDKAENRNRGGEIKQGAIDAYPRDLQRLGCPGRKLGL